MRTRGRPEAWRVKRWGGLRWGWKASGARSQDDGVRPLWYTPESTTGSWSMPCAVITSTASAHAIIGPTVIGEGRLRSTAVLLAHHSAGLSPLRRPRRAEDLVRRDGGSSSWRCEHESEKRQAAFSETAVGGWAGGAPKTRPVEGTNGERQSGRVTIIVGGARTTIHSSSTNLLI